MKIKVRRKNWTIKHEEHDGFWGFADFQSRKIVLHSSLKNGTRRRLSILVHELTHACFPEATEAQVVEAERIISQALWNDGWRRKLAGVKGGWKRGSRRPNSRWD